MPEYQPHPEWFMAAGRYLFAAVGVVLVAHDVIEQAVWDQIAGGLLALVSAGYGIWRTREMERERDEATARLKDAEHLQYLVELTGGR